MNLSSTIKSIQDIMRKDDGLDGDAQRLGQLTWMLFLKVFDQREDDWLEENPDYQSPLPDDCRWRNWAAYSIDNKGKKQYNIGSDELIPFVNNTLFPALKEKIDINLGARHKLITQVFKETNNYMKSGSLMLCVIEKLDSSINLHDLKTRTSLGDVYEQLLNDLRGAGNSGEFYTPRALTEFMVERVNPRLSKRETVIDPACGTGGFLTAAIEHLNQQIDKKDQTAQKNIIDSLIYGIEKKQLPHMLCTTNLLLHGIDVPSQIEHQNTLAKNWADWTEEEKMDCVITNPPFGGFEDDIVGNDYPEAFRSRETADMFMVLIIKKLLKENGRAAVVLPDGFLFGEGIKSRIKQLLLRECNLHTIVRLPKGVFAPYTSINSNLMFFTKKASYENTYNASQPDHIDEIFHTETIWYYEHPYPSGYKSYSKTKPLRVEEFQVEREWWGEEIDSFTIRQENDYAWKLDFKSKRESALQTAQLYWNKAQELHKEATIKHKQINFLKNLKTAQNKKNKEPIKNYLVKADTISRFFTDTKHDETQTLTNILNHALNLKNQSKALEYIDITCKELTEQVGKIETQAQREQAKGDQYYWSIFNLDIKNPRIEEEENLDPEVLLKQYKTLLNEIEKTENLLKSELSIALSHHFENEDVE